MKQRKKSFGMRISAFVLSFAMVCTLLAGVNVVAFAADGDQELTVSVSKFYNDAKKGGDGEHLFTKDADEISWLSSLPTWNNEGVAWKAPVSSSTSVYRCYNPNSGEHLYVDEGYADYLAGMGWNKEKLAFYSDDEMGVPVYRLWNGQDGVGSHHFTTDSGEVEWLVGQGWTAEDVAFYGVKEDQKDVVTLTDLQGFQADGTALTTDTLQIVFGSTFGTPKSVAWYKNGAVVAVYVDDIGAADLQFCPDTEQTGEGSYYAVVENTQGQSFKTKEVTVVEEGQAIMSGVSIADNYDALTTWASELQAQTTVNAKLTKAAQIPTTYDANTENAVIDVTVNKAYNGYKFYVVTSTDDETVATVLGAAVDPATAGAWAKVKASEFNGTTLYKKNTADAAVKGIYYAEDNGTTHYKFWPSAALTRGTDYMVVYSDEAVNVADKLAELNVTDKIKCPYMMAPTSIEITGRQTGADQPGWGATLSFMGVQAAWISETNDAITTATGGDFSKLKGGVKMYENASVSNKGGTYFGDYTDATTAKRAQGNAVLAGQGMCVAVEATGADLHDMEGQNAASKAVYATFTGPKEIFGEKVELTSEAAETAVEPLTAMTISENKLVPENADVTLTGLRSKASGTVYLLQGDATNDTFAKISAKDLSTAVGYAEVEGGAPSVTIEDVFDNTDFDGTNTTKFVAVFVPDDTDLYGVVADGDGSKDVFELTEVATSYELEGTTTGIATVATDAIANTNVTLLAYNQFDGLMDTPMIGKQTSGDAPVAGNGVVMTFEGATGSSPDVKLAVAVSDEDATAGDIYFQQTVAGNAVAGDTYTYKLNSLQSLTFTCTKAGAATASEWTISIE